MSQASPLRSNLDVRTLVMIQVSRPAWDRSGQRINDLVRTLWRDSLVIIEVDLQRGREIAIAQALAFLNSELSARVRPADSDAKPAAEVIRQLLGANEHAGYCPAHLKLVLAYRLLRAHPQESD